MTELRCAESNTTTSLDGVALAEQTLNAHVEIDTHEPYDTVELRFGERQTPSEIVPSHREE